MTLFDRNVIYDESIFKIIDDVKQNGGHAMLTNKEHKTGIDRIYEVLQKLNVSNIYFL